MNRLIVFFPGFGFDKLHKRYLIEMGTCFCKLGEKYPNEQTQKFVGNNFSKDFFLA